MTIPTLTKTEQALVAQMRGAGVPRWALIVSDAARPYIYRVMAAFLREECTFHKVPGLVVGPSGNMHRWWAGGWEGTHLSSVRFMNAQIPSECTGAAAFDEQPDYSAKYLTQLTAFLQVHAQSALFLLPPEPSVELGRVLAAQRFVHLNVK